MPAPVHLVKGADPLLLDAAVRDLVRDLVGSEDASLTVEELDSEDYPASQAASAAQTPPFLTSCRVVVARNASRFTSEELAPIVAYLGDPLPTTSLVLEWVSGAVPKKLLDVIKAAGGHIIDASVPQKQAKTAWLDERFRASGVHLEANAKQAVIATLADDLGRLPGLLDTLLGAFGPQARISLIDVTPFLGESGTVPPWELTDAIDAGRTAEAVDKLRRMLSAGDKHPLQILATLHGHYGRMLRLDGAGASSEAEAAAVLGLKGSTFPARKAMQQLQVLKRQGVTRAIELLAQADLDVRGATDWSAETVAEVLVARLSRLGPARAGSR
jgi:DNA polymerase-3 subunit delta